MGFGWSWAEEKNAGFPASKSLSPQVGVLQALQYFSLMLCACFVCWGYVESLQKDASLVNF